MMWHCYFAMAKVCLLNCSRNIHWQLPGPNTCKSSTCEQLVLTLKWIVLEDYWELEARIQTTHPGNGPPEGL